MTPSRHPIDTGVDIDAPLATLHHAHGAIVGQLAELEDLPRLVVLSQRARELAARVLVLFNGEVLRHHQEEERQLFPAVQRSAAAEERPGIARMVERLRSEHRWIERLWRELEPDLKLAARGRAEQLDAGKVTQLVRLYGQHAAFEEQHFLPLAQAILARRPHHLQALGLAMHMDRLPEISGHV